MDFDTMILCYDCGSRLREDHVGDLCPACAARYDANGYVCSMGASCPEYPTDDSEAK